MTRFLLTSIFCALMLSCNEKQTMDSEKARIVRLCETFMQNFRDAKLLAAMDILRNNSIISKESIDELYKQIISQESVFIRYGKVMSYEFVEEKKVKEFLSKRFYLLRFEHYYSVFQFTIYKGSNGWTITHFKFDDELAEVLN